MSIQLYFISKNIRNSMRDENIYIRGMYIHILTGHTIRTASTYTYGCYSSADNAQFPEENNFTTFLFQLKM